MEEITQYMCDPLRKCLRDDDPYVRKTAAISVAKLYDISPQERNFIALCMTFSDQFCSNYVYLRDSPQEYFDPMKILTTIIESSN